MSHHKFTTPRVVYLGQAYRGQDDRPPRSEARPAPSGGDSTTGRLIARPAEPASRASLR